MSLNGHACVSVCVCHECVGRRLREYSAACSECLWKFVEKVSKQEHPLQNMLQLWVGSSIRPEFKGESCSLIEYKAAFLGAWLGMSFELGESGIFVLAGIKHIHFAILENII